MNVFLMDNKAYNVHVLSLKQKAEVTDTDKAGRAADGSMVRDIIGTYYNYTMEISKKTGYENEFDEFFTAIVSPVDYHWLDVPHNQSALRFKAYVTSGERDLISMTKNLNNWGSVSVNFIAMEPQIRAK